MNENDLLQYALVGDLLQGGIPREKTLELIAKTGFKPDYVTVPELRTAYDILVAEKTNDEVLLRKAVVGKLSVETLEKAASKANDNALDIEQHVLGVRDAAIKAKVKDIFAEELRMDATGENVLGNLTRRLGVLSNDVMSKAASEGYSLAELGDPIPEEKDPDCLFKGRFLTKGSALVLASVSGSGKSVITLQLAYAWALGRPAFGIVPMLPLKIGIFQTEDDAQEMASFRNSMRQGYERFHNWTADDLAKAEANIRLFPMDGKVGNAFVEYVRRVQLKEETKCDLVIINPLQGVTDFDISENTGMRAFVRQKLDGVIKLDPATKCGLMIVHHTNKPSANAKGDFGTDQFAQYVGAGASELTNWMRAMLSIMPTNEIGQYKFVAAKRGGRLGWPQLFVKNKPTPKPTKIIRHSTPDERVMFWHEVDAANAKPAETEKPSVAKDAAQLAAVLQTDAKTLTEARKLAKDMFKFKRGEAAYEELMDHLSDYKVADEPTGKSNSSVIGSAESIKKWFSAQDQKAAAEMRLKLAKMEAKG